jgi:hypothetical protein
MRSGTLIARGYRPQRAARSAVTGPAALVAGSRCDAPAATAARSSSAAATWPHPPSLRNHARILFPAHLCTPGKSSADGAAPAVAGGSCGSSGTAGRLTRRLRWSCAVIAKVPALIHRVTLSSTRPFCHSPPKVQDRRLFRRVTPFPVLNSSRLAPIFSSTRLNSSHLVGRSGRLSPERHILVI